MYIKEETALVTRVTIVTPRRLSLKTIVSAVFSSSTYDGFEKNRRRVEHQQIERESNFEVILQCACQHFI